MDENGLIQLDAQEVRVLGALMEKELTTPEYYPLTPNAITLACNQTSNREPVMSLDESTVMRTLDRLRDRRLAYLFGGAGARAPRFGHKMAEVFAIGRPEVSLLCVLFLRGTQTVGELRTRTARMHGFESLEATEEMLAVLASHTPHPLVVKLARLPGFKEPRFAHAFAAVVEGVAAPPPIESPALGRDRLAELEREVADLRRQLDELRQLVTSGRQ